MLEKIVFAVMLTSVVMLAFVKVLLLLTKRKMRSVMLERHRVFEDYVKEFSCYPSRKFSLNDSEYEVFFVWDKRERITVGKLEDYHVFCPCDVQAIQRYIELNPSVIVLNIPTYVINANRYSTGVYKVIKMIK